MLRSIIDYVKYHYQFCENIESCFLSNNLNTNECYIKSCLVYKYLFELYFRKNVTLDEIMTLMDITDFLFITNSPVLKNHLIFHHAFKTFWKIHKNGKILYKVCIKLLDFLICVIPIIIKQCFFGKIELYFISFSFIIFTKYSFD